MSTTDGALPSRILAEADTIIQPLEPFGEKWTPTNGTVDIDKLLKANIHEVVRQVRRSGLIVLESSVIGEDWPAIYPAQMSDIAQLVSYGGVSTPPVQMLHGTEGSPDVSYSRNADLHAAGVMHIQRLKERLQPLPEDFLTRYGVNLLVEAYEQDEPYYSDDFLSPRVRVAADLQRRHDQAIGVLWEPSQTWPEIMDQGTMLQYLLIALMEFKRAIARDVVKRTHNWATNPGTTVLAAQDMRDRFTNRERLVFHHMELGCSRALAPIRANYIIGNETRYGMKFQTHTDLLREQNTQWKF